MNALDTAAAKIDAAAFDFDEALGDAQERFDRKAQQLSAQDRIVEDLAVQLAQAQLALNELQGEYTQAAQEEETLMAYLGKRYDYATANESRYAEYGD